MLVWIDNAPSLEKSSDEEIVQFVDKYLTCSVNDTETAHLVELQTHKHSRTCRKKKERQYVDLDFLCLLCLKQGFCIR